MQACAEWRQWSELEAAGLNESDWQAVARCQAAKKALQPVLHKCIEQARAEWKEQGPDASRAEREVRSVVAELIALEKANHESLAGKVRAHQRQRVELSRANRNLDNVHRSYGHQPEAGWQSYS